MKNLLITGGTGFVGSHLAEMAAAEGYRIFALVRKNSDTRLLESLGVSLLQAELTDRKALETVFQELKNRQIQLEIVVHCAALTKAKKREAFRKVNVGGTRLLLEVLSQYQHPVQKFVFLSSLAASGPAPLDQVIRIESAAPVTQYGQSKLEAEKLLKTAGFPYLILRPTAVYGPREKDIFTLFQMLNYGVHPLIGSHRQQLTFIYVRDLVTLILKAVNSPVHDQIFFATDGKIYSKEALGDYIGQTMQKKSASFTIPLWLVKSLAVAAEGVYFFQNKTSPLNLEKYAELKAQSWVCEVEKTFTAFDFLPAYELSKGVAETTRWYQREGWLN